MPQGNFFSAIINIKPSHFGVVPILIYPDDWLS